MNRRVLRSTTSSHLRNVFEGKHALCSRFSGLTMILALSVFLGLLRTSGVAATSFEIADAGCVAPMTSTVSNAITNALEAQDDITRAHWDLVQIHGELDEIQGVDGTHKRAQCYSAVMVQGPAMMYDLIKANQKGEAWSLARTLAKIWQRYHSDSWVQNNEIAQGDYEGFPDGVAHVLHYGCNPTGPTGDCPWPVPSSVKSAVMGQLLQGS